MSNWTPARSVLLSQLLDNVVGTEEMVRIRQDYCRISDCIKSIGNIFNSYYTGSKADGLDLPGSDMDFMGDINNAHKYICDVFRKCPSLFCHAEKRKPDK